MNNLIPQGFLHTKASAIEAKIIGFKQAGVSQLQVVLDFDRTLTVGVTKNREDSSSWQILKDHLQPEARQKVHAPFDYYRAKEVAGTLTIQEATDWWSHSLDLMQEYRLDLASVEKDFMSKSTIRPGAKELFELCALHNIPTIILSAGVKEVIDIWTKAYDIHPTMTLATELELDENKRMIGWKKESLVHTLNKKEVGHPELTRIRESHSHTILAGDSMHDSVMAEGEETVFRVRIYDQKKNEIVDHAQTFALFDTVIDDGTLFPLVELIEQIASAH